AHAGKIIDREAECAAVKKINRLWRDRLHHRLDLLARLDARRVEAVGACIFKGTEPANNVVEIGHAANETFSSRREYDIAAGAIDRRARGLDPCHGDIEGIKRGGAVVRRVLDGKPSDAGRHAARDVFRKTLEIVSQAIFEIRVQRYIGRRRKLAEMRKHGIAAERAVGVTLRMRITRARG